MNNVDKAKWFAAYHHSINDQRYGRYPYIHHLADRLANVQEALDRMDQDHFEMYQKEYPEFREALFNEEDNFKDSILVRMWARLDEIMK